jgi:hypothetical protein
VQDLEAIAKHQGVEFRHGDILIVRTGLVTWFRTSSEDEKARAFTELGLAGVKQGEETQRWLWDNRFSAVAGDGIGWECKLISKSR